MTPQDDWLPKEREEPYATLIILLQRAYSASTAIPPDRQAQIIARVQERLLETAFETPLSQIEPGQLREAIASSPRMAASPAPLPRRWGRFIRLSAQLAAVLVIGAIIYTALFISLSRPQKTGAPPPPIRPLGKLVTIHTQAGGLEATMQITAGPFFLGELIAADLSATNHTSTTYIMEELFSGNPCWKGEFGITMTGGGNPHYTSPLAEKPVSVLAYGWKNLNGCDLPPRPSRVVQWKPGQTITSHQYLVLTGSGQVTIAAEGAVGTGDIISATNDAFHGHWPSLRIDVQSRVPPDRVLSLKRQGEQVFVTAPLEARSYLVYVSSISCTYGDGSFTGASPVIWKPLSTTVLHQAHCDDIGVNGRIYHGKFVLWEYAISAPGYAIAWGSEP